MIKQQQNLRWPFSSSSAFTPGAWFALDLPGCPERVYIAEVSAGRILIRGETWFLPLGHWFTPREFERNLKPVYLGHGRPRKGRRWLPPVIRQALVPCPFTPPPSPVTT